MSEPFVGEIRIFGGSFAPRGWAFCAGQLLAISQNDALFSLLGTIYGGDGRTTFGLPDMRGRLPVHMGQGNGLSAYVIGEKGGAETVTLLSTQLPNHNHPVHASTSMGSAPAPGPNVIPASPDGGTLYSIPGTNSVDPRDMADNSIQVAGGNQPHNNMMPYLGLNFIIALVGVYPSRN